MFRTAIVGCGAIANTHAGNLAKMHNVVISAVCDILPERANKIKETYALDALVFDDYKKMLDEVKPDVLHVCTPHYLHSEMAVEALKRNINVMLEKPVSISLAQARAIIDAEKESSGRVCVSFQNRFLKRNKTAKELVSSGKAGKVIFASGSVLWSRGESYYRDSHWRGFKATEGGGVMINQAIHTLDLLQWICGEPEKLCAKTANFHLQGVIDVEDTCDAYLYFKDGGHGMFHATTANFEDAPVSLTVKCENMLLELKNDDLYIDGVKQELHDSAEIIDGKPYWGAGHKMLFNAFYSAIETGEPMPVTVADAIPAVKLLLAMYASDGKDIEL